MRVEFRLPALMGERRLKINDVARGTGLRYSTVYHLYHGRATMVSFEAIAKLCAFLGCEPGDLLKLVRDGEGE